MVSKATQWRLAQMLAGLAAHQRDLVALRVSLTEHRPFNAYEAFRLLDRRGTGSVDSRDILTFLLRNHLRSSPFEAYLLLRRFDSDQDGRMTYQDFVEGLGGGSAGDKGQEEYVLVRVMSYEKDWLVEQQAAVKQLLAAVDFSMRSAFRVIDRGDKGHISPSDLDFFLTAHAVPHTVEDIRLVCKSLDRNRDGRVDFPDFLEALIVLEENQSPSAPRQSSESHLTTLNRSVGQLERLSLASTRPSETLSSNPFPQASEALFSFNDFLQLQLDAVRSLEEHKQTVILQSDFHPLALFRQLDVRGQGSLKAGDLAEGLGRLGLRVTAEECFSLLKLYDLDCDGRLSAEEFYALFRPHSSNYLLMLTNRKTSQLFSYETTQALIRLFDRYFSLLKLTSTAQARLEATVKVGVSNVFQHLERGKAGFFTEADLRSALREVGLSVTPEEMKTFMRFYDRRSTGLVRFDQLCETLAPEHPPRVR